MNSILRIVVGIAILVTAFIVNGNSSAAQAENGVSQTVAIWGITTSPLVLNIILGIAALGGTIMIVLGIIGALKSRR